MSITQEIRMISAGLKNRDYRPGAERQTAERRLHTLLMTQRNTNNRARGIIHF